ncbi:MAG: CDP-glycerol glycerophosphotransferase family protein [Micrococcales bacterium]|nr:CDP-glycerol glycerophosphotransferase family protein [Micrococcales bacterium]
MSTHATLRLTTLVAHATAGPDEWRDLASLHEMPSGAADEGVTRTRVELDLRTLADIALPTDGDEAGEAADPQSKVPPGLLVRLFVRVHCAASAMPRYARRVGPFTGQPSAGQLDPDARQLDLEQPGTGGELAAAVARHEVSGDAQWVGLIPIGRFVESDIGALRPVTVEGRTYRPYVNRRGWVQIAIDRPLIPFGAVYVSELSVEDGRLELAGDVASRHCDILQAHLVLLGRTTGLRLEAPAATTPDEVRTCRRFGLRHTALRATLDIGAGPLEALEANDVLDAWLEITTQDSNEPHRVRIGNTPYFLRRSVRAGWRNRGPKTVAITPYYTFKAKRTSFHIDVLDTDGFELLQRRTARLRSKARREGRPVWLVGERPYKAQDTGLAFFRYLRRHHREVDAYYVIDRSSPEVRNLEGLDHVIWHRSKEHIELALRAERFIGSHHPDYLYPTWLPQFRKAVNGAKVFLQHGVMGTKWMVPNYGKHVSGFDTDLFLVSSAREKEYIVSDFGYAPDDVPITGLSRFDSLFADDVPLVTNQILVIPTWRDWLQDPAGFEESQYRREWQGLINDPRLRDVANAHGAQIIFCLHPNMQHFHTHFADAGVRVVSQGEVDVQLLIKQSAIMVTDYSSVGFDFSFLGKPVIYFQFDRERFLGSEGSHIDLDRELPGPIGFFADDIVERISEALADGATMPEEYARRADRFIDHRDRNNCKRIHQAVLSAKRHPPTERVIDPELRTLATRTLRRTKAYSPAMRRLMWLYQRLPMDRDIIVFESGLGKQYADSPRYIYEELLRRRDPRKKVWVYDGRLPVTDHNTITVQRLSPEYYWYLARAKYWVNNQNFPHYMRRRRHGVFIQTWHGTPLKRMQHDLPEIHGRDPGYLQRVTNAMRQWSALLSPSPYATAAFRRAFRYDGPVLEVGYPRNDVLADPDRAAESRAAVRRRLGLRADAKTILYAPTFRDDQQGRRRGRFRFDLPFALEDFAEAFDDNTVLLLRMHVLVDNKITIPPELRKRVMDVSAQGEIQELFLASDVLVTDYSSVFFDYAILHRPIVFYAYDLDRYRDTLRGFYLDYTAESLPGPIVETPEDLWAAVRAGFAPDAQAVDRIAAFAQRYAPMDDGRAAVRVVDELMRS